MIGGNRVHEARETGEFVGSLKDGRTTYDIYVENSKIILKTDKVEMEEAIIVIGNSKEDYVYTPYLEAYNAWMYNR